MATMGSSWRSKVRKPPLIALLAVLTICGCLCALLVSSPLVFMRQATTAVKALLPAPSRTPMLAGALIRPTLTPLPGQIEALTEMAGAALTAQEDERNGRTYVPPNFQVNTPAWAYTQAAVETRAGIRTLLASYTTPTREPIVTKASYPNGATAYCKDGTWSYSPSREETCHHHGGVEFWVVAIP